MLALPCILLGSTVVTNSEIVGKKMRICRRSTLGFAVGLVHEKAAEDIGEFQVMIMFRMPTDSFDGPSTLFPQHTACPDGTSIDKALYDNVFRRQTEWCNTRPHVANHHKPAIVIVTSFSL